MGYKTSINKEKECISVLFCMAVVGTTLRLSAVQPLATGTVPTSASTTTSGFGLF